MSIELSSSLSAVRARRANAARRLLWSTLPVMVAALVVVPMVLLVTRLLHPTGEVLVQLWSTILPEMIHNTLLLMLGVAVITFALGSGLAWLVTAYRFPGSEKMVDEVTTDKSCSSGDKIKPTPFLYGSYEHESFPGTFMCYLQIWET